MSLINPVAGTILAFIAARWRPVAISVVCLIVLFYLLFAIRSCFNKPPKLDEKAVAEARAAIEQRNDEKLREILVEAEVKENRIDANVANSDAETVNAIYEARRKYANMNTSDLAAELERRK